MGDVAGRCSCGENVSPGTGVASRRAPDALSCAWKGLERFQPISLGLSQELRRSEPGAFTCFLSRRCVPSPGPAVCRHPGELQPCGPRGPRPEWLVVAVAPLLAPLCLLFLENRGAAALGFVEPCKSASQIFPSFFPSDHRGVLSLRLCHLA